MTIIAVDIIRNIRKDVLVYMDTFEKILEEIPSMKNIDDLFSLWKKAHELEENPKNTFPINDGQTPDIAFRSSFCPDGVTSLKGDETNDDPHVDVLFVLKEANTNGKAERNYNFWFNDGTETDDEKELYRKRLCQALQTLKESNPDISIDKFGYMNVNKRGGYGDTCHAQLENYAKQYADFLRKQIELHSPKHVVFCGCYDAVATTLYGIGEWNRIAQSVKIGESKVKLYYIYHPSKRNCDSKFEESLSRLKTSGDCSDSKKSDG